MRKPRRGRDDLITPFEVVGLGRKFLLSVGRRGPAPASYRVDREGFLDRLISGKCFGQINSPRRRAMDANCFPWLGMSHVYQAPSRPKPDRPCFRPPECIDGSADAGLTQPVDKRSRTDEPALFRTSSRNRGATGTATSKPEVNHCNGPDTCNRIIGAPVATQSEFAIAFSTIASPPDTAVWAGRPEIRTNANHPGCADHSFTFGARGAGRTTLSDTCGSLTLTCHRCGPNCCCITGRTACRMAPPRLSPFR
jgi:hypothetical protein